MEIEPNIPVTQNKWKFFTCFHANLAFSAIPEEHYPLVIDTCYQRLLQIVESGLGPVGININIYTLLQIEKWRPKLLDLIADLWKNNTLEVLGSGYMQIIFPLAPAEINQKNFQLGQHYYRQLLGREPETLYVNEQTYSASILSIASETGFKQIIMEWNNSSRHGRLPLHLQYQPVIIQDQWQEKGTVLWNNSIAFQKFQRFCFGDLSEVEYREYIEQIMSLGHDVDFPCFCLYGSDLEIFDYQPGSPKLFYSFDKKTPMLDRMEKVFKIISSNQQIILETPAEIAKKWRKSIGTTGRENSDKQKVKTNMPVIHLESTETPIPCKKQEKYNLLRWAVTGRGDVNINTICHCLFDRILDLKECQGADLYQDKLDFCWEKLLFLWGSDFRTHTTDQKWNQWHNIKGQLEERLNRLETSLAGCRLKNKIKQPIGAARYSPFFLKGKKGYCSKITRGKIEPKGDQYLNIVTPKIDATLNLLKGCAFEQVIFPDIYSEPLFGTAKHGRYEEIGLGADFFSGHLVFQERGGRKFTDLDKVKPQVVGEMEDEDGAFLVLNFPIAFSKGLLYKSLLFGIEQPLIKIHYHFKWDGLSVGAYRIGIVTLNSEAFVRDQLRILVKNGGNRTETFNLTGYEIDHTKAVNFDISANQCLGASDGVLILKDNNKGIKISVPKKICYSVPLLTFREFFNHEKVTDYFCRISHSIGEMDDTAAYLFKGESSFHFKIQGIN